MKETEKKIAENKQWLLDNVKYITRKDYEVALAVADKARDEVPEAHCRVREASYNYVLINAIKDAKARKGGKSAMLLVKKNKYLSSWPHAYIIDELCALPIDEINYCAKTICHCGGRYHYHNVIAIVKA